MVLFDVRGREISKDDMLLWVKETAESKVIFNLYASNLGNFVLFREKFASDLGYVINQVIKGRFKGKEADIFKGQLGELISVIKNFDDKKYEELNEEEKRKYKHDYSINVAAILDEIRRTSPRLMMITTARDYVLATESVHYTKK